MAGFFSNWAANLSDYKRLQKELTDAFAQSGVNFMGIHPEINKCMIGIAREEGALSAVAKLREMTRTVADTFPDLSREQSQQQLIRVCKAINALAK